MSNLRNDRRLAADEFVDKQLANDITGYVGAEAMAILVDRTDQVGPLRDALYARRDAAPVALRPFEGIHALEDFVPRNQAQKIPCSSRLKAKLLRARARGLISDADWTDIERHLPSADLAPFRRRIYRRTSPAPHRDRRHARTHRLHKPYRRKAHGGRALPAPMADAYRETRLPDGSVIIGSGRAVIYADMWAAVIAAIRPAVTVSFLMTTLVVLIAFRVHRSSLLVLAALLVGVGWLGGMFTVLHVRLNFLNFIALPITFGIGVDYAVNVVQRYLIEGKGGAVRTIRETGGAVVLCSLTTTLGISRS